MFIHVHRLFWLFWRHTFLKYHEERETRTRRELFACPCCVIVFVRHVFCAHVHLLLSCFVARRDREGLISVGVLNMHDSPYSSCALFPPVNTSTSFSHGEAISEASQI